MSAWTFDGDTLTDGVQCFDVEKPESMCVRSREYLDSRMWLCDADGERGAEFIGRSDVQTAAIVAYYERKGWTCGVCRECEDEYRSERDFRIEHAAGSV